MAEQAEKPCLGGIKVAIVNFLPTAEKLKINWMRQFDQQPEEIRKRILTSLIKAMQSERQKLLDAREHNKMPAPK